MNKRSLQVQEYIIRKVKDGREEEKRNYKLEGVRDMQLQNNN